MRILLAALGAALVIALSPLGASAQSYTPTTMTPSEIIAKMVAATGQLQDGSYLITEREDYADGTVANITTEIYGSDFLTIDQHGDQTDEFGSYRGQNWDRDPNGTVIVESSASGEDNSSAYVAWVRYQSERVAMRVLGTTQTAPQAYAIAFTADGSNATAFVDVASNRLDRLELYDGRKIVTFSDYRSAYGVTAAHDVRVSYPQTPQNGRELHVISLAESQTSDDAMQVPQSQPLFDVAAQASVPARFTYSDGMEGDIIVTARINGQEVNLVVDSGAPEFVIDPGAAARLGLSVHGKRRTSIAGGLDVSETLVPAMTLGDLTMHNVAFTVMPVGIDDEGVHAVGLIGCDFFATSIVGLNFKDGTMTLYPRSSFDPTSLGVDTIPIRTNGCQAQVAAMFENVPGVFTIDTGATATVIDRGYLAKLPHSQRELDTGSMDTTEGAIGFLGGAVDVNAYVVDDFEIGRAHV